MVGGRKTGRAKISARLRWVYSSGDAAAGFEPQFGGARLPKDCWCYQGNQRTQLAWLVGPGKRAEPWSIAGPRLGAFIGLTTLR
jgi:hypothetical protein